MPIRGHPPTRSGPKTNPARVHPQPGPTSRRTRAYLEANPGRMQKVGAQVSAEGGPPPPSPLPYLCVPPRHLSCLCVPLFVFLCVSLWLIPACLCTAAACLYPPTGHTHRLTAFLLYYA